MNSGTLLDIAMNHSDKIILQAQQGDRNAFNKLVSLWYKRIYNFAFKYFNDHDMASEVAQNSFIILFKSLKNLRDITKFKSWLYTIALNKCREEERRAGNRSKLVVLGDESYQESERMVGEKEELRPDQQLMRKEASDLVLSALESISEEQREVIIMKEYEGLKFREIAEILEVSENTVKSRLYYGFSHLKKLITEKGKYKEILQDGK